MISASLTGTSRRLMTQINRSNGLMNLRCSPGISTTLPDRTRLGQLENGCVKDV